jgi:hypothetical protein
MVLLPRLQTGNWFSWVALYGNGSERGRPTVSHDSPGCGVGKRKPGGRGWVRALARFDNRQNYPLLSMCADNAL